MMTSNRVKIFLYIVLVVVILAFASVIGYAAWYEWDRVQKIAHNEVCDAAIAERDATLAKRDAERTDASEDDVPADIVSEFPPCAYELVPPTLRELLFGAGEDGVIGPAMIRPCDPSATTTSCGDVIPNNIPLPREMWPTPLSGDEQLLPPPGAGPFQGYEKISPAYAIKDGTVYFIEPIMRHTASPQFEPVIGADAKSFQVLFSSYSAYGVARDTTTLFIDGKKTAADPETFTEIGGGYFKDASRVYRLETAQGSPRYNLISLAYDAATFRIFTGYGSNTYTIDKDGVYFADVLIQGINPATLTTVSSPAEIISMRAGAKDPGSSLIYFYLRDEVHVIYLGDILQDADPKTFTHIYSGAYVQEYGKDANNVYFKARKITGADPATYKPLSNQPYEGCKKGAYGIDEYHVYFEDLLIEGADPATLEVLIGGNGAYAKDVNHVYLNGVVQEELDPASFTPECNYG